MPSPPLASQEPTRPVSQSETPLRRYADATITFQGRVPKVRKIKMAGPFGPAIFMVR